VARAGTNARLLPADRATAGATAIHFPDTSASEAPAKSANGASTAEAKREEIYSVTTSIK
jgi:hypothetical protein